jgi:hypothetical protein
VQPGETLFAIAIEYGVTVAALQSANGITDPGALQVNQELIIPTDTESQGESLELTVFTPTPLPFPIEGVAFYETPVGSLWCLGEVVNSTQTFLENVQLQVVLYDPSGQELVRGEASTALDLIPPGGQAPFGVLFTSPPESFDRFVVTPIRAESLGDPGQRYASLELDQVEASPVGPLFEVTGTVINASQQAATSVTAVVTLYDSEGLVTGFREARLPENLAPGDGLEFAISLIPHNGVPANYAVAAQGRFATQ